MRCIIYCKPGEYRFSKLESFRDDYMVMTAIGKKRVDQIVGSTKASVTIYGTPPGGDVIVSAKHGGTGGNKLSIELVTGPTGQGYEHRPIDVNFDEDGDRVTVVFGTDANGGSLYYTSNEVASSINSSAVSDIVTAQGTGLGTVVITEQPMQLTGGKDDGDWRKFNDKVGTCIRVSTVEMV